MIKLLDLLNEIRIQPTFANNEQLKKAIENDREGFADLFGIGQSNYFNLLKYPVEESHGKIFIECNKIEGILVSFQSFQWDIHGIQESKSTIFKGRSIYYLFVA